MGRYAITSAVVTAVAVALIPTATWASVNHRKVHPGDRLTVSDNYRRCPIGIGAKAHSGAFGDAVMIVTNGHYVAHVTVKANAEPKTYPVEITCGRQSFSAGIVTVLPR